MLCPEPASQPASQPPCTASSCSTLQATCVSTLGLMLHPVPTLRTVCCSCHLSKLPTVLHITQGPTPPRVFWPATIDLCLGAAASVASQVNNAGILISGKWDQESYDSTFAVNTKGPIALGQALLPHLAPDAVIVMVSSGRAKGRTPSLRLTVCSCLGFSGLGSTMEGVFSRQRQQCTGQRQYLQH